MRGRNSRPGQVQDKTSERLLFGGPQVCGARLSLDRTRAVPTSDQTAKTVVFWVPTGDRGDFCEAWNGREFVPRQIPYSPDSANTRDVVSLNISSMANATTFDVFARWSGGRWTLRTTAWNSTTARWSAAPVAPWLHPDGLGMFRGRLVCPQNGGAYSSPSPVLVPEWLYVGTIYTSATGQVEDSAAKRFVWNLHNQVRLPVKVVDTTNSWTYSTATLRQANGSSANGIKLVCGTASYLTATVVALVGNSVDTISVGVDVGIDSTTVGSAQVKAGSSDVDARTTAHAVYRGIVTAGYHDINWLEISATGGTTTWYGDNGLAYIRSGLTGEVIG